MAGMAAVTGPAFRILVFTRTTGYRHQSIPAGVAAVQELAEEVGIKLDVTDDPTAFAGVNLAPYRAVVWLSTSGGVLDDDQRMTFAGYIRNGGGFVGVHCAAATEYGWPWYEGLVGAYLNDHPTVQPATILVEDGSHPSTAHLGTRWTRVDEWYNFRTNPRPNVHVLARLDESSYQPGPGAMGDHPIAWYHEYDGGRSWYTGLGHTIESFGEPLFRQHLLGGIRYAAGISGPNESSGVVP
jgi:cytochrome c